MSSQPQVFISYQRTDGDFARLVREHLVAHGVRTWMDQYDIPVGAYWPDEIDRGLGSSDIVIGVLSPDAVESRNVKNEWDWTITHNKPLILLKVSPCDIPHRYVSLNFIDASGHDLDAAFVALLVALGVDVSQSAGQSPDAPAAVVATSIRHRPRRSQPQRQKPLLVGREREASRLSAHLNEILTGRSSVVLVAGEAGIGKTTLTSWLAWEAEQRGAIVLTGGCYDLTTTPPYGPWLEIIRAWPDDAGLPSLPEELRTGEQLAQLSGPGELFAVVADLLAAASTTRPLVLLLEDLHWADQATLDLLRHVSRTLGAERLLLVATYRDDEVTRRHPLFDLLPVLVREAGADQLSLPRLSVDGIRALVSTHYELADSECERLVTYVTRVSDGNPFFAGEVLHALEERGSIARADGGWTLESLANVQIPALVRQVIERRLGQLTDDDRRLLEAAAVLGHDVSLDQWVAVTNADEAALTETLERAVAAHMVEESRDGDRIRFTHALIRETLYGGLVSLRRRAWHRKAGEVLASANRPDPDEVAHHFQQAGDARAFDWLIQAGNRADERYAWIAAAERYEAAAALIEGDPERTRDHSVLLWFAATFLRYTDLHRARTLAEEARRLASLAGDVAMEGYAAFTSGLYRIWSGDARQGIEGMVAATRQIDSLYRSGYLTSYAPAPVTLLMPGLGLDMDLRHPYTNRVLADNIDGPFTPDWGTIVMQMADAGRLTEALGIGERLAQIWPPERYDAIVGNYRYSWSDLYGGLATAYRLLSRPDDARRTATIALDGYRNIRHHRVILYVLGGLIENHLYHAAELLDEREQLSAEIAAAHALATGAIPVTMTARFIMLPLLLVEGSWSEARTLAEQWLGRLAGQRGRDDDDARPALAMLALHQGRADELHQHQRVTLPAGAATEPGNTTLPAALAVQRAVAEWHLAQGDLVTARTWIETYDHWLGWSGTVIGQAEAHLLWSWLHRIRGDTNAALERVHAAIDCATDPRRTLMLVAAQRALGELLTDAGQFDAAEAQLAESLALADACAAPFERALTLLAQAELAAARTDHVSARALLDDVRAICEPLEARPTLERAVALKARLA